MKPSSLPDSDGRLTRSPTSTVTRRALVVDDDPSTRDVVRRHLGLAGFAVDDVCDELDALGHARAMRYDVLLLGITAPGLDGLSLCRAVRRSGPNTDTPIVLLSPPHTDAVRVRGLHSGADDWLEKPLQIPELEACVTSLMRGHRRVYPLDHETVTAVSIQLGPQLHLDVTMRRIVAGDRTVTLTRREFELLHHLAARRNAIVDRDTLVRSVWGANTQVGQRTVDLIVSRLRRKLELDPRCPRVLLTAWGVGYTLSFAE